MTVKIKHKLTMALLVAGISLLPACAGLQRQSLQNDALLESDQAQINSAAKRQDIYSDDAYHLLVAEVAIFRGDIELAAQSYLKVARNQNNPQIAERAVRVAVYGENMEVAIEAARRWVELAPERIEARQVIAAIYIRQDKADEAFEYLDEIIQTSEIPDAQLFGSLANVLGREKNMPTVLEVTRKMAMKYQDRAWAQYLHGLLAVQGGQPNEALTYLDKAALDADIQGVHNTQAKILLKLGRREEAVISLQKALQAKPDDQGLRLTYARLLVDLKQYKKAGVEFEKLHRASPDDVDLLYTLGLLSLETNRLDEAEKYMLRLVEINQRTGEATYYLGRISESRGDHQKAIERYRQVHVGEYLLDAKLRIADMLSVSGRYDEAHDHIDSMLKGSQSDGSLVRIYLSRGRLFRSVEDYQSAMEAYTTALGIVPGNTDLLYARSMVWAQLDRIDELEQDIHQILKTEPNNAFALNVLGFTLADRTDRYQEAYGYLERAIEIMPDDAAIIDSFGWVNYRLGKYDEAVRLLRRALSQYDDSEIAAHLGEVLWVTGEQDEAKGVWKKALKKSPDDPLLEEVMQRFIR